MVSEISPSHVKTFHYPSQHLNNHHPTHALCDVSALALGLNFKDQVRSRHHVQVQSPISTALYFFINVIDSLGNCIYIFIDYNPLLRILRGEIHCCKT